MIEEEIIQPISRELLKAELTEDKRLRMTNKSHNQIYIVTADDYARQTLKPVRSMNIGRTFACLGFELDNLKMTGKIARGLFVVQMVHQQRMIGHFVTLKVRIACHGITEIGQTEVLEGLFLLPGILFNTFRI